MPDWKVVIGLEVHAQLATQTKLFCGCRVEFGAPANTHVCPICLGMPGVLPVPNAKAVEYAVQMGLATECQINQSAMWTRKNYFYPDLPKGYQITQQGGNPVYDQPICAGGSIDILSPSRGKVNIGITRIHMEEDAGKLIHDLTVEDTLFDANRCGTPLIEIVSNPDLRSPQEAVIYLQKIKQILEYLGISDANMECGNLRCDANISIRPSEDAPFGTRAEIKNMNSFTHLEAALEYEIDLQIQTLENGGKIDQVTKRWDPALQRTSVMRSKEEAEDYRYFPEPDMIRLSHVNQETIENLRKNLPELPEKKRQRFQTEVGLSEYDASVLTSERWISDYFDQVCIDTKNSKAAANWILGDVLRLVKENEGDTAQVMAPKNLAKLVNLIDTGVISGKIAKQVFAELSLKDQDPEIIVEEKGWKVISDAGALEKSLSEIVAQNPEQVEQYRQGKTKVMGFFVGQAMKATQGKADPATVNQILIKLLQG